ncbi:MAG: serine protease, partial [Bacteroidales bacterium]
MRNVILLLLLLLFAPSVNGERYFFRIWLTDKVGTKYSTERPKEFLSGKSVERRIKQGIKITETDLPLSDVYVGEILKLSGREVCHSNWMNTLVVESSDSLFASVLDNLPFVKDVEKVFEEPYYKTEQSEEPVYFGRIKSGAKNGDYGDALMQIEVHGGDKLHKEGFRGEGVTIA